MPESTQASRPRRTRKASPRATASVVTPDSVSQTSPEAVTQAAMPEPKALASKKRRWGRWKLGVVFAVVLILLLAGGFLFGISRLNWRGRVVDQITAWLPFPIAVANNSLITYHDYHEDISTLTYYYDNNQSVPGSPQAERPSDEEIATTVLNRLVYDSVVADLVKRNDVVVTDAEMEEQLSGIAQAQGSREGVTQLLQSLYGWDESQFKEKVLRPYIGLQKLETVLNDNGTLNGGLEQRANDVLVRVQAGDQSFEDLAKQYSEDTTASVGGDLGFFGAGEMVKEFEDAVRTLTPGQTSALVKTEYGYHIIQLVEKVSDPEQGEQFHARHILLKTKSIDDYVNEQLSDARIHLLLAGYRWDKENHWIVPKDQPAAS